MKPHHCPVCGTELQKKSSFGVMAGNTVVTELICPECNETYVYSALVELIKDNKSILAALDEAEDKEGDFPWPDP